MSLVNFDGSFCMPVGPSLFAISAALPSNTNTTIDAANEAQINIGRLIWADGGSHTVDTTGSSSIGWQTATVTFANAGTTVKVGIGSVDTTTGPPARATNAANVITFDVSKSIVGGGGGITGSAWQTHTPDAGTKTIASGDLVAVSIQMTARGGTDSVLAVAHGASQLLLPAVTGFTGGSYTAVSASPNIVVTASDGTIGWIYGSDPGRTGNTRSYNNSSATKEYGQMYKLPFPVKVYGIYGWCNGGGDFDAVLYSDPLGTPVAEKTSSFDANAISAVGSGLFTAMFSSPYSAAADQQIGAVLKPTTTTNISTYYKTLGSAAHRVTDPWGVDGSALNRASGAFTDGTSGVDNYYVGLLIGAYDAGGGSMASPMHGMAVT